jgi:hypothetical protein
MVRNEWSYTPTSAIRIHGVVINYSRETPSWDGAYLNTGAAIPFTLSYLKLVI